jgi:four helix bundle protein
MKENLIKDKSFAFALQIIKLYQLLQGEKEYIISKQLLRSGTSIGANVCESEAAVSRADFRNKLSISAKEAHETKYWLQLLQHSTLTNLSMDEYLVEIDSIIRILSSIVKKLTAPQS